jgi:type IV secretion system protein VirB10
MKEICMSSIEPGIVPNETGVPGVGARQRRGKTARLGFVVIAVIATIGAVIGLAIFVNRLTHERELRLAAARTAQQKAAASNTAGDHDFDAEKARLKAQAAADAAASAALPVPVGAIAASGASGTTPVVVPPVTGTSGQAVPVVANGAPGARDNGYSGVLLDTGRGALGAASSSPVVAAATSSTGLAGGHNALDEQLAPSATSRAVAVSATLLPDLTYLLKRGTMIPCIGPKIVTTYAGMITCTLMQDVYSADGTTLLLRKGATANGEQRTALLQGQARIFALWTSVDDGAVTVPLDSPATDPLGGSGIDGWTDTHFWTRFGGALMVSFIGDAGQVLSNLTTRSGGGTQISLSNTSQATQELAAETLRNTINVPPTAYANQGTVMYIHVARNVDFRSVYELVHE